MPSLRKKRRNSTETLTIQSLSALTAIATVVHAKTMTLSSRECLRLSLFLSCFFFPVGFGVRFTVFHMGGLVEKPLPACNPDCWGYIIRCSWHWSASKASWYKLLLLAFFCGFFSSLILLLSMSETCSFLGSLGYPFCKLITT